MPERLNIEITVAIDELNQFQLGNVTGKSISRTLNDLACMIDAHRAVGLI